MTVENIKMNLEYLTNEPRIAGSSGGKIAEKYLVKRLTEFGFQIELHGSKFMGWEPEGEPKLKFIEPEKRHAKTIPMIWSNSTNGTVKGKLVPDGKMFTFEVYPFNKYSIKNNGEEVGFVLSNRTDPDPNKITVWMQPLNNPALTMPCTLIESEDCDIIENWLQSGEEIEVEFEVKTKYLPESTFTNIIAIREGEIADTIAICAHYDSILGSTGANDNGSGIVALLEIAERLIKQKTKHTLKFILSDAEEWNKLGTYTYVEYLKGKDEIKKIKTLINIDTVGAGEYIYCLAAKSVGDIVEKSLAGQESEFRVELTKEYRSPQFDGWPFHKENIPVVHFGCRPYTFFHTPMDSIEKINYSLIESVAQKVIKLVVDLDSLLEN